MKRLLLMISSFVLGTGISNAQLSTLNVGDPAPSFTVTDLHGTTHTLEDYDGKYILLDLFAYWCGPCQQTAPVINEFYRKYGCNSGDMIVLAFEADGTEDQTQNFEDNYGGSATNPTPTASGLAGGGSDAVDDYNPEAFPTICLVDGDGKIASKDIWPVSNVGNLESAITSAGGASVLVEAECEALSTPEIISVKTVVFPNPATSTLNVLSNTTGDHTVEIKDMLGRVVFTSSSNETVNLTLDVSAFETGQYILSISSESGIENQMFVVK